jgi:uncharacterized protein YegL
MTDPNYTHIGLVVDRSGSMSDIAQDMNGGIQQLLRDQTKAEAFVKVDVATFDNDVEFVATDATPESIMNEEFCNPRGSTALNDAIGQMINRLGNKFATMPEEKRPSQVIVVIVTDGMENASREYTSDQIKAMVTKQTDEYQWTFMYLAANVDAFATGGTLGFGRKMSMGYAATAGGTQNMWAASSANIARTIAGDHSGYTDEEREAASEEAS